MNKNIKNLIKLAIGLSILFFLFYKIGFAKIWGTLISVNPWVIPMIIVIHVSFIFLGALNSWLMLQPIKRISYIEFMKCYIPSWVIGLLAPGKIGEASIVYFLKKKGFSIGSATAVTVMDKAISLLVIAFIASLGFFILFPTDIAVIFLGILIGGGIIGLLIISSFGRNLIRKIILKKYQGLFSGFANTFFDIIKWTRHKARLYLILIWTNWSQQPNCCKYANNKPNHCI
jgi:uncharacterized membrane protein YbhN (UPF0104 family)